ncbi:MAG: thioredoxin family protein [Prosthecochloris sp.]|uniref:thioredoxin family protein n=1 Tax=unclassified Prosthecochloris TaxID=2632826 RepID=UPI000DF7CF1C|nr:MULTISPECIES: thioredoxin family protein [unclassified Prosthecochloris]MCW8798636.1 thioredoxin family protein [Prosthecochloris sp.]NEX11963.1 thioredoxin family protein [Prosthecochloris sp.]RDD30316.1 thioredoxin family protein [Prosthecochloris sp. ZM]
MKNIKVLGTGCPNCKQLESMVRKAVEASGTEAVVEKVEDIEEIMSYNILSTPALVIDEEVKCSGRIPSQEEIQSLIA